jgi:TonB family protein
MPPIGVPELAPSTLPIVAEVADPAGGRPSPALLLRSMLPSTPDATMSDDERPGQPLTPVQVDEPAEVIQQGAVRYPAALERAGIGGRVELEYVVDSLGQAESGSLRVIEGGHPAFEAAARAAVLESRNRPARAGGRPVRQLVRQRLSFQVN